MSSSTVRIRAGGPADLELLEPLWVAVHHQHVASMPELAPYVDDATTWAARRALYAELLAKPDTVLLLFDRLEAALAEQGVTDLVLGVLPGNTAALRLYERRGWRPTWLYLSRFAGRAG